MITKDEVIKALKELGPDASSLDVMRKLSKPTHWTPVRVQLNKIVRELIKDGTCKTTGNRGIFLTLVDEAQYDKKQRGDTGTPSQESSTDNRDEPPVPSGTAE